ncbi:MAG: DUF721 domain-containing protein [Treponema sp.]|nr:DUF721 domain-containing protein [Treponema sp.]
MKTAGDILSAIFDERFVKKARGYSKFFDSWIDITAKNGIAAAGDHSRIKDLDRGIIKIEMDHPGWKQIIQTKQSKLLNDFRMRFPELDISGISLILGKSEPQDNIPEEQQEIQLNNNPSSNSVSSVPPCLRVNSCENINGFDAIEDEEFKEKLRSLGQSINAREKL